MTQHIRKFSVLGRNMGFRMGLANGLSASDWAFDSGLASPRVRNLQAGMRYDLETLREDFLNAERRFAQGRPRADR